MAETTGRDAPHLDRSIGLLGAVALVVGAVVGAGIYVQIAPMALQAGYALAVAFLIAMLISLIGVLPVIQLAGALPRAGAGYLFASRLLSPMWGVIASNFVIVGGGASSVVVALTLAIYLQGVLPVELPVRLLAILVLAAFYLIYQFGVRFAMGLQVLMAAQFVGALILYTIFGVGHVDLRVDLAPIGGFGDGVFLMAVLLCYSTCMGFQVVAELGEEIRDARRNIPLSLILGGGIVAVLYIVVGTVFVNAMPPDADLYNALLNTAGTPLMQSSESFLPERLAGFVAFGALTAGLTSLNAGAIAIPREIFAQGRDGVLPEWLARISPRTHAPQHAVTAYFAFVMLLVLTWQSVDFYGYCAAIGILFLSAMLCVAALRLPSVYPERQEQAYIRFPHGLMWFCAVLTILVSLGFSVVILLEGPLVLAPFAACVAVSIAYYRARTRHFTPAQRAALRAVPGDDEG